MLLMRAAWPLGLPCSPSGSGKDRPPCLEGEGEGEVWGAPHHHPPFQRGT